jgi:excisionase family DNA binding protein
MAERVARGTPPIDRLLLDVEEVAEVLHCGRTQVFRLLRAGDLPGMKIGGLTRVSVAAVEEFVARKTAEAAAAKPAALPLGLVQWRGRR